MIPYFSKFELAVLIAASLMILTWIFGEGYVR
jgi:hypothetical protein